VVSFHPLVVAQKNFILPLHAHPTTEQIQAVASAHAVVLPLVCPPALGAVVAALGRAHFPRPWAMGAFNGKVGNYRLFKALGLAHPPTREFAEARQVLEAWDRGEFRGWGLPVVVKGAGGGQGGNVALVGRRQELVKALERLEPRTRFGPPGLVVQRFIPQARDLRVELVGGLVKAYWRVPAPGQWKANLSLGGRWEEAGEGRQEREGIGLARRLADAAGIDVAGVDVIFDQGRAFLLEINFFSGRRAFGSGREFNALVVEAVRRWLKGLGIDPQQVQLAPEA